MDADEGGDVMGCGKCPSAPGDMCVECIRSAAREEGRREGIAECVAHLESMAVEATDNIDAQVYWRAAAAELEWHRHVGAAGKGKL